MKINRTPPSQSLFFPHFWKGTFFNNFLVQILKGVGKSPKGPRAGKKFTLQSSGLVLGSIVVVLRVVLVVDSSVVLGVNVEISMIFSFCT